MAERIRWGVLSTALIGTKKVIPGLQRSQRGTVAAIASRDLKRAQAAAAELGIPKAYGSYDELLADPEVDAVYNPLPNNLHVPWTIKAIEAGKHVLCEKPIGMTAEDAAALKSVAGRRHVMEAFMVRFHPQWLRARELIRAGRIGEVRAVQVFFAYDNRDPENIRNKPETGGGALLDIGCYGIVSGRFAFEAEPTRVVSLIDRDSQFGVDRLTSVIADFGAGRHLAFVVGTQVAPYQRVNIVGARGRIEILVPFNAPQMEETRIRIDDGSGLADASAVEERIAPVDQYAEEGDAFARAVLGETELPYGIDDALKNMQIIDAIFRSGETNGWEPTGL
jgi:predicted dehydrogenase